jgi:hypothetical protein
VPKKIRQFRAVDHFILCCGLCFYQEYEFDSMKDPYQRPGFMSTAVTTSQAVYTEEEQPDWCRDLAAHWTEIRDEYLLLSTSSSGQDDTSDHTQF